MADFNELLTAPDLKGKKILFANFPSDGHFNPLTSLAIYLKEQGCDVRWYSSRYYKDRIEKFNIPFYPFIQALDWSKDTLGQVFPGRTAIKNKVARLNYAMINVFIKRSTEYLADICQIYQCFPFDVLIADNCFTAIPLVKEKLGVPVIAIGVIPLAETSKDLPPMGLGLTPANNFFGKRKQDLQRFIAGKILFRKANQLMKGILKEHGIHTRFSNIFDLLTKSSTLLLQSGVPGFEYKRSDLGKNIRFIGPLLPYAPELQHKTWTDPRLAAYEKIIVVTQGTVEKDTDKIIQPVLEAFKDTDYLVIATTGGSRTQQLKFRYPHINLIIEDFIPFKDILSVTDVYITNGGYGGVMLAIMNNVPLVVAGVHEGKNEVNARVGYFRLGINLGTEFPSAQQIKLSVDKIFSDPSYRNQVKKTGAELRSYDPAKLCAYYISELFVEPTGNYNIKLNNEKPDISSSFFGH
jgi:MGT family glycosyltransferase